MLSVWDRSEVLLVGRTCLLGLQMLLQMLSLPAIDYPVLPFNSAGRNWCLIDLIDHSKSLCVGPYQIGITHCVSALCAHLWSSSVNPTWTSLLHDLLFQVALICLACYMQSGKSGIFYLVHVVTAMTLLRTSASWFKECPRVI